jgi:hypothetical protein
MEGKEDKDNYSKWSSFALNIKFPHEGFGFSYDIILPTEEEDWITLQLRVGFFTFIYEWGYHSPE